MKRKSIVLYDIGGALLVTLGLGTLLVNFFWNAIVLSGILLVLKKFWLFSHRRKIAAVCIATILGEIADIIYFFSLSPSYLPQEPRLIFVKLLIPAMIIGVLNFLFSKLFFKFKPKESLAIGVAMGILTAPWLFAWGSFTSVQHSNQFYNTATKYACLQDSDCVIGIQPTTCCSCPKPVNIKFILAPSGWERYEFGKDYSSRQSRSCGGTVACKPCELPEKPICQNGQCQFSSALTSQEFCEIGQEYENTTVNPVKCKCPEGYKFETLSMGWGPCPQPGMRDCPSSVLKCVTTENIPSFTSQDLEKGWYWGFKNQRKPGTPSDWIFTEAGRSSCWHKPQVNCF